MWFIQSILDFCILKGLNFLVPVIDSIKYVQSLKELAIDIPQQSAITAGKICSNNCDSQFSSYLFRRLQKLAFVNLWLFHFSA